ncbi:class I SAM-dependent methyltransferase [Kibdelosporangium philippinense]|uniref:Class I SAM-dependent methyltransferase n=2 Tax=Kibdelosporangium philippinense TaxID=211113 RepID=A0ABS8ZVD9_9PSEU|nr:class I SAM-dependent methyltransferase [Kibdelosporangium philippinense]MCE7010571.1 class I SAM-dependent methyltransferase [Kibdelosporangium philippinense]
MSNRWNHNIHYHPMVLSAVPAGARTALDVGCGEGMLARLLRKKVPDVVGVDLDQPSIDLATQFDDDISYVVADVLTYDFPTSFDFIASVATLHHMDAAAGLTRLKALLSPGGTMVIVGLAKSQVRDLPYEVAGVVANQVHRLRKGYWEHPSPICWPPPETYTSMRRLATTLLPGVRFRHHIFWRYSLTWAKPE